MIKIQSSWRSKFSRKYLFEVIYMSYLQMKVLAIIRNALPSHIRPYSFDLLFSKNKLIKDLGDLLSRYEMKYTNLRIRLYFLK